MAMNNRYRASLEFQAPDARQPSRWVCPTCRKELSVFVVTCDGHAFETYRCRDHGDVTPAQSHAVTGEYKP